MAEINWERLGVVSLYMVLTLIIAIKNPEYLSLWASITQVVLTFYLTQKLDLLFKKVQEIKPKGLFEDLTSFIVFALIAFVVIVIFTYIFVHIV
jgi:hypothetical protein